MKGIQNCIQNQKDKNNCTNGITPLLSHHQAACQTSLEHQVAVLLPFHCSGQGSHAYIS